MTITKATGRDIQNEMMKINFAEGAVSAGVNAIRFIDKDTHQYVFYIPSVEISGYGETEELAREMMDHAIKEFFSFLLSLGKTGVDAELTKLGWKHNPLSQKEYFRTFITINGELQALNAEENSVRHLILTAA